MPVYEYYCDSCGETYESLRAVSKRDDPVPCPKCDGPGKRQLSAFAFKDGQYGRFFKAGSPRTPSPEAAGSDDK